MPMTAMDWARRRAPELALAVLAGFVFLGFLGSVDLWGKREQRASAEAIDTIRQGHWLIAEIQGRPRLEKPPLPRWTIATLMAVTGRQDEWVVRLPSALSALGMVALVYALGCRLGDRSVGLASGLALTSFGFFISELRQAGNDGPLAFFTTLALYAAWRRLNGGCDEAGAERPGARGWVIVMYTALGLGFLTKGPVILIMVALTVVPYLAVAGRLKSGLRGLASGWGLFLFALLALSWPVPVLMVRPKAAEIWYLEMAQKAVSAGVSHHRARILALDLPWMTAPWLLVASSAVILPFLPHSRNLRPSLWFPWWWAAGNLVMLCFWKVAKPNYYLPCLPGAALLTGIEWVRLTRAARGPGSAASRARRMLQLHWVLLFVAALAAPVVVHQAAPAFLGWTLLLSVTAAAGVVASAWAWRRGADAGVLAPLVGAMAVGILVGYGVIAPAENSAHSHRELAAKLQRLLPPEARTIMFYHELDEGLWFYLSDRTLKAVPGSQAPYNDAYELVRQFRDNTLEWDLNKRVEREKKVLVDWLQASARESPYVLIRSKVYDQFGPDMAQLATPLYREHGLKRNEMVLLRVTAPGPVASGSPEPALR
jgi:4-amino-4-deoxy-L-arabinose transferase-like glycosyltransferase